MTDGPLPPGRLSRRDILGAALAAPLLRVFGQSGAAQLPLLPDLKKSSWRVGGGPGADRLVVTRAFDDQNLRIGTMRLPDKQMLCCFNWADEPVTLTKPLDTSFRVTDLWTGLSLGRMDHLTLENMPPHSARLLECTRG